MAAKNTTENKEYLDNYTVTQLKAIAKEKGIARYSTLSKAELLEVLKNGN